MHPEQIKASIRMAGTTPAIIADELGVSRTSMSQIIHGTGRSQRIEQRISEVIHKPVSSIWPNRKTSLVRKKGSK
jgi:lambda repressor-like predicted transcriptional regulator